MATDECRDCQAGIKFWVNTQYGPVIERLVRLEEQHQGSIKALALQANEYERRLEDLNNLSTYVLTAYKEKIDGRLDILAKDMAELKGVAGGKSSTRHLIVEVVTMLIAAVAIAASVYLAVSK